MRLLLYDKLDIKFFKKKKETINATILEGISFVGTIHLCERKPEGRGKDWV